MAMIYVFIEGGEDKSQHTFWKYINVYVYSSALTIVPVGGVSNILSKISDYSIDNKNDIVILVVDNLTKYALKIPFYSLLILKNGFIR